MCIRDRIPLRPVFRRRRPTDPLFDSECRAAKRLTRRLERAYAAACRRRAAADATAARVAWYDQRRAYRQLRQQKCRDFWAEKIETERSHPAKLWRSVDQLLGRGRVPMSLSIAVEIINQFADKVANVRLSTDNAPPPTFTHAAAGLTLNEFDKLSVDDVTSSVRQLSDKSFAADPIPTFVLKQTIDLYLLYSSLSCLTVYWRPVTFLAVHQANCQEGGI